MISGLGSSMSTDDMGTEQEVPKAGGNGNRVLGKPSASPLRVAIVNDYELIVAGLSAMLAPHRTRVDVVELDVDQDPEHAVDVALFDSYGQPGLGEQAESQEIPIA